MKQGPFFGRQYYKTVFLAGYMVIQHLSPAAQPAYNANLLDTLQQIAQTSGPAKYFAQLYHNAIAITNGYAARQPDSVRQFIFGFEAAFAPSFFNSYKRRLGGRQQAFSWQTYYQDSTLNGLQYQFMGMNAHINGDMCAALTSHYPLDSLVKYKRPLLQFQKALNVLFDSLYNTTYQYRRISLLHHLSFGLDRLAGRAMVLHWRRRQVNLALLFYRHPKRWAKRWRHLQKEMQRWNGRALFWLQ